MTRYTPPPCIRMCVCVFASNRAIGGKHCALSQEITQSDTTIWSELEMGEEEEGGGGVPKICAGKSETQDK